MTCWVATCLQTCTGNCSTRSSQTMRHVVTGIRRLREPALLIVGLARRRIVEAAVRLPAEFIMASAGHAQTLLNVLTLIHHLLAIGGHRLAHRVLLIALGRLHHLPADHVALF